MSKALVIGVIFVGLALLGSCGEIFTPGGVPAFAPIATLQAGGTRLEALSNESTAVALELWQAGATQSALVLSTERAWQMAATQQAWVISQTQVARDGRATETARAAATEAAREASATAWAITETPLAATQAAVVREADLRDSMALWAKITRVFFIGVLGAVVVLIIVGFVLAYRRLMPAVELRVRSFRPGKEGLPVVYRDSEVINPGSAWAPVLRQGDEGWVLQGAAPDAQHQERTTARNQAANLVRALPSGQGNQPVGALRPGDTTDKKPEIEIIDAETVRPWLEEVERKLLGSGEEER